MGGLLLFGALLVAALVRPARAPAAELQQLDGDAVVLEEAA
jgi:hypothetical protein